MKFFCFTIYILAVKSIIFSTWITIIKIAQVTNKTPVEPVSKVCGFESE